MNPVFRAAAESAQYGWVMGLTTVFFMAVFIGWTIWSLTNRKQLETYAQQILDDGDGK